MQYMHINAVCAHWHQHESACVALPPVCVRACCIPPSTCDEFDACLPGSTGRVHASEKMGACCTDAAMSDGYGHGTGMLGADRVAGEVHVLPRACTDMHALEHNVTALILVLVPSAFIRFLSHPP